MTSGVFLGLFPPYVLKQCFLFLNPEFTDGLEWLVSGPEGPPSGSSALPCTALLWVLEIQTEVLRLMSESPHPEQVLFCVCFYLISTNS